MIERIQNAGAMAAVVDISNGFIMRGYHRRYKALAAETQAIFIPNLFKGIMTNPSLKSDSIHPNAQGYRIIAQRVYGVINPFLRSEVNNI